MNKITFLLLLLFATGSNAATDAGERDCQDGQPNSTSCRAELRATESSLIKLYEDYENLLTIWLKDYEPSYIQDAIQSFKDGNSAWKVYRDRDCLALAYGDGMNSSEVQPVADACSLERTQRRIVYQKSRNAIMRSRIVR